MNPEKLTDLTFVLISADYSYETFNYDDVRDDFSLAHFDHNLTYDQQRVIPMIRRALATASESWQVHEFVKICMWFGVIRTNSTYAGLACSAV